MDASELEAVPLLCPIARGVYRGSTYREVKLNISLLEKTQNKVTHPWTVESRPPDCGDDRDGDEDDNSSKNHIRPWVF